MSIVMAWHDGVDLGQLGGVSASLTVKRMETRNTVWINLRELIGANQANVANTTLGYATLALCGRPNES